MVIFKYIYYICNRPRKTSVFPELDKYPLPMKTVRVFAPASIANLGCGFDIMGLALDEVGDVLEMSVSEGDGLTIANESGVPLPEDIE